MTTATHKIPSGYKQTDIGVIPADWDVKRLGDIVQFNNGKAHEQFINDKGDYVVVNSKFISTEGEVFKSSDKNLSPLFEGEIVMVMSDIPHGRALAKCFFIRENGKYTLNQRICSFKSINSDSLYLFYKLNRNKYFLDFDSGVGQTNLRRIEVLDCPVAIPSDKKEQSAIATALSDTDALIEKLEKLIEKKNNIKQGAMQKLLTGKRRLPGFSGKWVVRKLEEIAEIAKGQGLSKGKLSLSGKYPCILYGELFTTYKEKIDIVYSNTDFQEGRMSQNGDVLIPGSTTTTGIDLAKASALLLDNVLLGGDINIIRPLHRSYDSIFLAYCLTHIYRNSIAQKTKGVTIYHLHGKDLLDLEILMPDVEEQSAVATVLSDLDAEIEKLESQLTKYQNLKQGMTQSLLTGKIRLL